MNGYQKGTHLLKENKFCFPFRCYFSANIQTISRIEIAFTPLTTWHFLSHLNIEL